VTKLGLVIERLQTAEIDLAKKLRSTGERDAVEHDVFHLTRNLAKKCEEHVERLRPFAESYEVAVKHEGEADKEGVLEAVRRTASELIGRQPTGVVLLEDLRGLFLSTQDVAILWLMLKQAAMAKRDSDLLQLCTECETDTIAQAHWLQTRIKEAAPQALTV
jgi:hypothetical protein